MKVPILSLSLIALSSIFLGEEVSQQLQAAKDKFESEVRKIDSEPEMNKLSESYFAGLAKAKEKAQSAGKLEAVLEFRKELDALRENGAPDTTSLPANRKLARLREIYIEEESRIETETEKKFETLKSEYGRFLQTLQQNLTIAGKIEEAVLVRDEVKALRSVKLADFDEPESLSVPPAEETGKPRSGRVRGFGRLSGMEPWTARLDLAKLQKFDTFVDVAGDQARLLFLLENGDVLNLDGEVVGSGATKIFPSGYLDSSGQYQTLEEWSVPDDAQPLRDIAFMYDRVLGRNEKGETVAWGDAYTTGSRVIPERARQGIRRVAMNWDNEYVLTETGELIGWNDKGEFSVPSPIRTGVREISISRHHTTFVLTETNDLYHLNGTKPQDWTGKAQKATARGLMSAILDLEGKWHVFAGGDPPGSELETLRTVLNRKETIDAEFFLKFPQKKDKFNSSYVVWVEENGAPEIDVASP